MQNGPGREQRRDGPANRCQWLRHGREAIAAMLDLIGQAQSTIRLETFIFHPDEIGNSFRTALLAAQQRGVRVRVMCDAVGSITLRASYWEELVAAGGEFRWFNPLDLKRLIHRDHRKILVVDDEVAVIGGFNIGANYAGDGVISGWRDLGLLIRGSMAGQLADAFNHLFVQAEFRHSRFQRLRRTRSETSLTGPGWTLLLSGPGRGHRALKRALAQDFSRARSIQIMSAYFLPNLRLLRELKRAAKRGARVQLILAGKSDVWLMSLATRGLYAALLRAGVEVHEYTPQVLHAKLVIVDDVIYAGSANLDARSLSINYEVLARITDTRLAAQARRLFAADLKHCHRVERRALGQPRGWWQGVLERCAFFILARIDPYLARRQQHRLINS